MTDRPILFSGPMVRALIAGTKTQTRRTMKVRPSLTLGEVIAEGEHSQGMIHVSRSQLQEPRISIGDRLYVREHWRTGGQHDHIAPRDLPQDWAEPIGYIADEAPNTISRTGRFRQAMHMPRWASRLTLSVTDVRVERLQDCSEEDAKAEGVAPFNDEAGLYHSARDAYWILWDQINGNGAWASNPWVAAYTFTVAMGNIDQLEVA